MNLYDEIRRILKIPDIQRISLGSEFSRVFSPLKSYMRATNNDYDYAFSAESEYPAFTDVLTNEIVFVENALKDSQELARKIDLNALRFRQLFGLGSGVNELRHWKDLINGSSCVPYFFKFQTDIWHFCELVAKQGSEAAEAALPSVLPSGDRMNMLLSLWNSILMSSLWTETLAFEEERAFFKAFNSKEAKLLSKLSSIPEFSEKPCLQTGRCAIHDLASIIAKTLRERFGSLRILEQTIRKRNTSVLLPEGSFSVSPDVILSILLALNEDQVTGESINNHIKDWSRRWYKGNVTFHSRNRYIRDTKTRALSGAFSRISNKFDIDFVPLFVGKLHNTLKSMISIDRIDDDLLYGRIYVKRCNWNMLTSKAKKLCLDLFKLRLNVFHSVTRSVELQFSCKNRKNCPITEAISGRRRPRWRHYEIDFNPILKEQCDYLREVYSSIPKRLKEHYKENRRYFDKICKTLPNHTEILY